MLSYLVLSFSLNFFLLPTISFVARKGEKFTADFQVSKEREIKSKATVKGQLALFKLIKDIKLEGVISMVADPPVQTLFPLPICQSPF